MGKHSKPKYAPPPPPPDITDPEVEAAKRREREMLRRRHGRQSTILTGGSGVQAPATLQIRTLLGE